MERFSEFTIHFATINTVFQGYLNPYMIYLQYTLLLLIHRRYITRKKKIKKFTIHFATINTFLTNIRRNNEVMIYNTL